MDRAARLEGRRQQAAARARQQRIDDAGAANRAAQTGAGTIFKRQRLVLMTKKYKRTKYGKKSAWSVPGKAEIRAMKILAKSRKKHQLKDRRKAHRTLDADQMRARIEKNQAKQAGKKARKKARAEAAAERRELRAQA